MRAATRSVVLACLLLCAAGADSPEGRPEKLNIPLSVAELARARAADPKYFERRDRDGMTVLHRACERGDEAVVRRMLELGADAKQAGDRAVTPLHAVMSGAFADAMRRSMKPPDLAGEWSVEKARARELETRGQGDPQRGPMKFAEVTRLLISKGADPGAKLTDGFTPLHMAASAGRSELASILIEARADVNSVASPRGLVPSTPLTAAAGRADLETVRVLLDAGAQPAKVPEESRRPFFYSATGDVEVFRLLLDHGMDLPPDAMKVAARRHNVDVIAEIERRRARPKDAQVDQKALDDALYAAVKADHEEGDAEETRVRTLQSLLKAGASASAPDGTGEALIYAVNRGHAKVAESLRLHGAKVDWARLKDGDHQPAKLAYCAMLEGKPDRIKMLEDLGMPLDVWGASASGRKDRLQELLKQTPAAAMGTSGATPMYFAAQQGQTDCVRLLLDAGAAPNERMPSWDTPNIGRRPLDGAAAGGHADTVRLLLDRGADPKLMTLDEDDWSNVKPQIRQMLKKAP